VLSAVSALSHAPRSGCQSLLSHHNDGGGDVVWDVICAHPADGHHPAVLELGHPLHHLGHHPLLVRLPLRLSVLQPRSRGLRLLPLLRHRGGLLVLMGGGDRRHDGGAAAGRVLPCAAEDAVPRRSYDCAGGARGKPPPSSAPHASWPPHPLSQAVSPLLRVWRRRDEEELFL